MSRKVMLDMPRQDRVLFEVVRPQHQQQAQTAGSITLKRMCNWWAQMLLGLRVIHAAGMLHSDIKSANIMWSGPANDHACIIDFGIARACRGDRSVAFTLDSSLCSPHFRAPEIWAEKAYGFPADVFSMGIVFLQLLYGSTSAHLVHLDGVARLPEASKREHRRRSFRKQAAQFQQVVEANSELLLPGTTANEKASSKPSTTDEALAADTMLEFLVSAFKKKTVVCSDAAIGDEMQMLHVIARMLVLDPKKRTTIDALLLGELLAPIAEAHGFAKASAAPRLLMSSQPSAVLSSWLQERLECVHAHAMPWNGLLVATHILTQLAHLSRSAQAEEETAPELDAAAALALTSRLHRYADARTQSACEVALPAQAARVHEREWTMLLQLDGNLLRNFVDGRDSVALLQRVA